MNPVDLHPQPLTAQAFAPFGDVIETDAASHFTINSGAIDRFHDLARIAVDEQGRALISMAVCNSPVTLPFTLTVMERHPLGSQAFIPLNGTPMYVVVAAGEDSPRADQLSAFVTKGRQGINYHRGIWHMPMIGLARGQQWIIVDRDGPGDNCDVVELDGAVVLHEG